MALAGPHSGGDVAGLARPMLDRERLAEPCGKPLPGDAGKAAIRAVRREADQEAHRVRGIGLGAGHGCEYRKRGGGACTLDELAAVHPVNCLWRRRI